MSKANRLIVGITGASGSIYGIRLLQALRESRVESHLVISKSAEITLSHETELTTKEVRALADVVHSIENVGAPIASGSFGTLGMVVAPCSIRSLAEIAYGTTSNLLSRAADVVLKERKRLVLLVRETPLHTGHLRAMVQASELGAVVMPPVPAFYVRPKSVDDLVNQTVGRVLDLFEIDNHLVRRWGGLANGAGEPTASD